MADSVLITGGSGLLGRWTLRHWPNDSRHEIAHRDMDLLRPDAFADLIRDSKPDVVLHLAWCASGTPDYRHSDLNDRWVEVTRQAARACARAGGMFYGVGSVIDDLDPVDKYSAAKCKLRAFLADEIDAGQVGWLRPFYVFDQAARRPAVVAEALTAAARNTSVALRQPDARHDFIHASDVGQAIAAAVRRRLLGVVDVGSGATHPVHDLVERCGAPWHRDPRPVDVLEDGHAADTTRLTAIGWAPVETQGFFSGAE